VRIRLNKIQKVSLIVFIISLATLVALWYIFPEKIYNWYKDFLLFKSFNLLFFSALFSLIIFLLLSYFHHQRVSEFLKKKIPFSKDDIKKLKPDMGAMEWSVSGIALFDVLYHLNKVDPLLLSGVYRLHHNAQQFENYGEINDFLKNQIDVMGWDKAVHKYKGYVGEEHTISQQIESGADITVPNSGTNPGYDFIVDGQKYDRKVVGDSNLNEEIKALKDDEKLWVGQDSGKDYLDSDKVYVDPNSLTEKEYSDITSDSFEGIVNLGDFLDGIPLITLVFSSAKNYKLVKSGSKDIESAVEHVMLDTLGVGVGGYLGSQLGIRLGQGLAPATGGASLIVIPAVTTVLGFLIGIITGKGIVKTFKERHYRRSLRTLVDEGLNFSQQYQKDYKNLLASIKAEYSENENKINFVRNENQGWFMKTFFPNVISKFCSVAKTKSRHEFYNIKKYQKEILIFIKSRKKKEKKVGGLILYHQGKDILFGYNPLLECWSKVDIAFKKYKKEKEKLSLI